MESVKKNTSSPNFYLPITKGQSGFIIGDKKRGPVRGN